MADTKISALADGSTVQAGDHIPVERSGANYRVVVGSAATLASTAFDAAGAAAAVSSSLTTHTSSTSNPHSTTAAQVGAYTTAQADTLLAARAPLASPALTGTPTAPTAAGGTNTTQVATTAFVASAVSASGGGSVTTASVVAANGFAGTVANPTSTPAITLTTSVTGVLKGNGTAISPAAAGTDYLAPAGDGSALLVTATGSTTARTLASRAAVWYYAKDYGATFDGATDDTAAIQAACDAAYAAGGGYVFLSKGTAIVSSPIIVQDNVSLVGKGIGTTILKAKALTGSSAGLTGIARTKSGTINKRVSFRDFTLDGNKANQPQGNVTGVANNGSGLYRITSAGHGLTTGARVTTTGILNSGGSLSTANNSFNVTVIDANTFDLIGSAFAGTYSSGGTWAIEVVAFFCGVTPGSTNSDEDISVVRVEAQNCTAYGFDPHERTRRLYMEGCLSHDNRTDGFTLDNIYDGRLIGCVSYANGRHGFNWTTNSVNCSVYNCEAYGNGTSAAGSGNGFTLQNAPAGCQVANCTSRDNDGDGIYLNGAVNCTVSGNLVTGNTQHAIECNTSYGAVTGNSIVGNTIRDGSLDTNNSYVGIYFNDNSSNYCSYNTVIGNSVYSTGANRFKWGIADKSSGSDNNWVVNNQVSGPATALTRFLGSITNANAVLNGTNTIPAITPYASDSPAKHGFTEWNFDLSTQGTGNNVSSGVLTLAKINVNATGTLTNVVLNMSAAGTSLVANQQFVAVYDGSSGALLGQSTAGVADPIFAGATGKISVPIATPFTITSGQSVYVAVLSVTSGGACPSLVRSAGTSVGNHNLGLTTSGYRFAANGTALTAVPAGPLTLSNNTTTGAIPFWCAVN